MAAYLTQSQIAEAEGEVMQRRGERARAAELAKTETANTPPEQVDRLPIVYGDREPKLKPGELLAFAESWRANYGTMEDELIALKEQKLREALAKDGVTLPPLSPVDREKVLMARHLAKA
jgi:hypothetical protein